MMAIRELDSAAIRTARVLCIFFMMSVHLFPGPSNASFVTGGDGAIVGAIWLTFLGRASVATLSLISGFLLIGAVEKYPPTKIIQGRLRVLIVPMIAWNLVMLLAIVGASLVGLSIDRGVPQLTPLAMINALTGAFGPSINLSLFFLRDLFVSSALLIIIWRYIKDYLGWALAIVLILTVFELTAPVIFRPTILLFMLAGCVLRAKGIPLITLANGQWMFLGILLSAGIFAMCQFTGAADGPGAAVQNISKRIMLVFATIAVAVAMARSARLQLFFDRLEPVVFLAYLSHVLIAKVIWIVMSGVGVTLMGPSYLVYFFATPMLVFLIAFPMRVVLDALPSPVPTIFKGKSPRPA